MPSSAAFCPLFQEVTTFTTLVVSFQLFFGNFSVPGSYFPWFVGKSWDLAAAGKTRSVP